MEKYIPHTKLSVVKKLIEAEMVDLTTTALAGGAALGLTREDIIAVATELETKDFYKSMTTYANHKIWQDVYRP